MCDFDSYNGSDIYHDMCNEGAGYSGEYDSDYEEELQRILEEEEKEEEEEKRRKAKELKRKLEKEDDAPILSKKAKLTITTSSDEEKEENRQFVATKDPFCYDKKTDAIILEVAAENTEYDPTQHIDSEVVSLFARDICSYKDGSRVKKHCHPWGKNNVLYDYHFIVERKVFDVNSNVIYIDIRNDRVGTLMIDSRFFKGWTDDATMTMYQEYRK